MLEIIDTLKELSNFYAKMKKKNIHLEIDIGSDKILGHRAETGG